MKRSNPWALPVVKNEPVSRTFNDPAQEEPLTLTLRKPDPLLLAGYLEKAQGWIESHANGVPTPDGEAVRVPDSQWYLIATLMAADVPDEDGTVWSELDWIGCAKRYPNAWLEICNWLPEVTQLQMPRDPEGNSGAALAKP